MGQLLLSISRFFYTDIRYPFANVESFQHLMWITFCYSGGVNSIETNLQTYNLWTGQKLQVCKLLLIKFVPSEWQNVIHIKCQKLSTFAMDIFCYFNFCHCRRNNFLTLYPSVLDFWKIKFEKSSWQTAKINFEIDFCRRVGSKNEVWNRLKI